MRDYKELDVWKKSISLTTNLYRLTSKFPDTERYVLTLQMRRSAGSIAANIAEGWGRGSRKEYIQFLTIARGSLMELETQLIIAHKLTFVDSDELAAALKQIEDIGKMLNRLITVLKNKV